jgi:hypothetical protein
MSTQNLPKKPYTKSIATFFDQITQQNLKEHGNQKRLLATAREKLQNAHTPSLIKCVSYLRICCLLMRKNNSTPTEYSSYLNLMKLLSETEVEWWNKCFVSDTGVLTSDVPSLKLLLQPIEQLHK